MVGRPSHKRALDLWMNGQHVGCWTVSPRTGHELVYTDAWRASPEGRALSLSLPITQPRHTGHYVSNYFDNLLPDSAKILGRIATKVGASSASAFDLLERVGNDCVGAIQVVPAGSIPQDCHKVDSAPLSDHDVARILDHVISDSRDDDEALRISIAGAQEKTALLRIGTQWHRPLGSVPTTHILKMPLGLVGNMRADFSTSVENEWLCLALMRKLGFHAAEATIERFEHQKVLAVERFDRKWIREDPSDWIARLPQEDFCQITGTPPERKYEDKGGPGIDVILERLNGSLNETGDKTNFLLANCFNWMIAGPDGHAKNYSVLLQPRNGFVLTPFYDVLSAWPIIGEGPNQFDWKKVRLAMAARSENAHYRMSEVQPRHWIAIAKRHNILDFERSLIALVSRLPRAISDVKASLPDRFPMTVFQSITENMELMGEKIARGLALESEVPKTAAGT